MCVRCELVTVVATFHMLSRFDAAMLGEFRLGSDVSWSKSDPTSIGPMVRSSIRLVWALLSIIRSQTGSATDQICIINLDSFSTGAGAHTPSRSSSTKFDVAMTYVGISRPSRKPLVRRETR